jgi:hypothetical protein
VSSRGVSARVFAVLLASALAAGLAHAQGAASDTAVKAAYLLRFRNFVEWPVAAFAGPADPLVVAVYGDDRIAAELEKLAAGRNADDRPLAVRRLREGESAGTPHILYAGGLREVRARELVASVSGPVLTVADLPGGAPNAVLSFVVSDGRVRFNASLTAAAARTVRLSARLLAVANQVEGRP